jgi:hypothetical protein
MSTLPLSAVDINRTNGRGRDASVQGCRLQRIRPDHILVLNEIRKFRITKLHKRG